MDERLIEYYNTELRHLRETAGEFGREFPKIAGRLALDKEAKEICPDPYVERLLEGFAFLAARVHLKLDAEFPRFTQALFETVYPHYLSPTPSMAIVRFEPDETETALAEGVSVPRGTPLRSLLGKGERTACTFQTAHEVRLLPLRLVEVRYFTRDVGELSLPADLGARAALRIRIQTFGGVPVKTVKASPLVFYIRGTEDVPGQLYEQVFAQKAGLVIQSPAQRGQTLAVRPAEAIRRVGFASHESLLPQSPRGFEGYRLLREYFSFPQRFLFFELADFGEALRRCEGDTLDLVIALRGQETRLEGRVSPDTLELYCTPAINLFRKTLDPIPLSTRFAEYHVVPERNRPLDFEVFEVQSVTGVGASITERMEFRPFYLVRDESGEVEGAAFYTVTRAPRVLTEKEKQFGRRSAYAGSDVFLSLVDANSAPFRPGLKHLEVVALCTNRHLPKQMSVGVADRDFDLGQGSYPVKGVRCRSGPTLPRASLVEGRFAWRLVSHLALNYQSLWDAQGTGDVTALRDLLRLYVQPNDREFLRQLEGVRSVRARPVVRRVATPGPIAFARGLEITVTFDESCYEGLGVCVLGAVLEQFFARYVSLNSFTETIVSTQQRKEILRWPAQMGRRQIL